MNIGSKLSAAIANTGSLVAALDNVSEKWWKNATAANARKNTVPVLTATAAFRLAIIPIALHRNRPVGNLPFVKGASFTPAGRKFLYVQMGLNAITVAIGVYEIARQARQDQQDTTSPSDLLN